MPLKDAIPVIDDRQFADIVDEIRTRIARYTPEWQPVWTDFNDSDPGVTLTHVFAWLAEMLIYRMSKVPDLNYIKFLELIGIELEAAAPAQVQVSFAVSEDTARPYVDVPLRTQVSAAAADGGPPVVFETERTLRALTARLQSVQAFDGAAHHDVTQDNERADGSFLPFGELAKEECALVLGFGFPADYPTRDDFPPLTVDLAFWVDVNTTGRSVVSCGFPATAAYASATLLWECWNGNEWQAIDLMKDETLAFTRTGHVLLRTPASAVMKREFIGDYQNTDPANPKDPLFWMRARILRSQYEKVPRLVAVRTNTVAAVQAETVQGEVLGGSNGRRDQVFTLANTPVLKDTVKIEIDDGPGPQLWQVVPDFLGSGPGDPHVAVGRSSGEVRTGDGINGAIPVANANNPDANVIAREYRFGGGTRGNVGAGQIKTLLTAVEGIDNGKVGNLFPAVGGRDEETLEQAKRRAARSLRARCRAVTSEDFELLAMQAAAIGRAKALPLFHPQFPEVKVPGAVTVIVVPDSPALKPIPSEGTLRTVCAYLDQRRLLTTEVFVIAPAYQQIEIEADIVARDDADLAAVKGGIEKALTQYFHPLKGGDDGSGWPFGGTVRFSRVYQQVFSIKGVDSIERLLIRLDGEATPECRDIPIAANALLFSDGHRIDVNYLQQEENA